MMAYQPANANGQGDARQAELDGQARVFREITQQERHAEE
jgi:hypothetical protein